MTRHLILAAALTTLLGASGCVGQMGEEGTRVDSVRGSLGDVAVEGTPEIRDVRLSGSELFIDLRIQDTIGNWAMFQLTIPRDHDRASDEDGVGSTSLALRPGDADMLGCSGPDDGDWDFDCHPDTLDVAVGEGEDSVQVDFDGEFTSEGCGDIPYHAPPEGQDFEGSVDVDLI